MKKCIVIDIDGVLADSEFWQNKYFCSGFHDEDGYMSEISKFPVAKWVETMIKIYWAEYYDIYLLSSRHETYRKETQQWLKSRTTVEKNIRGLILKSDIRQPSDEFKLEHIKKLSLYNDIDIILDDNPKIIKILQDNGYNALQVKSLY